MSKEADVLEELEAWLIWLQEAVKSYPIDLVLEKIQELKEEK